MPSCPLLIGGRGSGVSSASFAVLFVVACCLGSWDCGQDQTGVNILTAESWHFDGIWIIWEPSWWEALQVSLRNSLAGLGGLHDDRLIQWVSTTQSRDHRITGRKRPLRSWSLAVTPAPPCLLNISQSTTSTCFLNTSRNGDSTTSLRSLFQCPSTLSENKFFLISNLNLP